MANQNDFQLEIITDHQCMLGECSLWNAQRKLICWIDVLQGEIHEYSVETESYNVMSIHQLIGSVGLCENGNFVAALKSGFAFIDNKTGGIKMINEPELGIRDNRFNDGKCDPSGRFLAGTMSLVGKEKVGSLYTLDSDLSYIKRIENLSISNGMAWSLNHKTLYHIDTPTFQVASYDYDENTGDISNKKIVIQVPENEGFPDGMTIDNEGMLWIAHWGGWQISRWDPKNGEKLFTFNLPVQKITSCTFGGENLQDIYITSANVGLSNKERKMQPFAGSLFRIKNTGFVGLETFKFKTV